MVPSLNRKPETERGNMDQLCKDRRDPRHCLEGNVEPPEIDALQLSPFLQRRLRSIPEALADIAETARLREQSRQFGRR